MTRYIENRPEKQSGRSMRKQVLVRFFEETEGALRYREVNSAGMSPAYIKVFHF
jgi:hypothetical protein